MKSITLLVCLVIASVSASVSILDYNKYLMQLPNCILVIYVQLYLSIALCQ